MSLRKFALPVSCCAVMAFGGCQPYEKQITTGDPLVIDNTFANPTYAHENLNNVLLIPLGNPLQNQHVQHYNDLITLSLLRNFGKFNYFNVQYQEAAATTDSEKVANLQTNVYDRALLGALGKEFNAQGILKVTFVDFSPYPPMHAKLKAAIFDAQTGEKVWTFDQVFDAEDSETMNSLKVWWNDRKAGGDPHQRFENTLVRPSSFIDYCSYQLSLAYHKAREKNIEYLKVLAEKQKESQENEKPH